jgi:pilus assembly protein CpaC
VNASAENILNTLLPEDVFVRVASQNGYAISGRLLGGLNARGGIADNILTPAGLTFPSSQAGTRTTGSAGVAGYSYDTNDTPELFDDTEVFGAAQVQSNRVDASIEAFERAGVLRVLAEPNLTAVSGESGRFLAGGEFPIPVSSENGEISIEFKPYGVALAYTPVVLSGGRISLKLSTEVSELTSSGAVNTGTITVPALQVRRAETTVELPSGGALVLAGLIQERSQTSIEGVPGVMDSPILGPLFRSRDFHNNETELVIIVTPYLVEPTSPDRLRTPADGFANPSEPESLLNGRLNALYRTPTDEQGEPRRLQGPHGHIIP